MKQITVIFLAGLAAMFINACGTDEVTTSQQDDSINGDDDTITEDPITGTLNSAFGTGGIVVSDGIFGGVNSSEQGQDIVSDDSGNIYVTGFGNGTGSASDRDMVIWKYDSTGTPDSTFGTNGVLLSNLASGGIYSDAYGFSIELDGSGNIYVVGYALAGNYDMVIWKYDNTGAPDNTFGTNGIVVSDGATGVANVNDLGYDLVLDASGNIYVAGISVNSNGDDDIVIWKYDSTGTLDNTFGRNGIVVSDGAAGGTNEKDGTGAIKLDGSGNIFVAGYSISGSGVVGDYDMVILKYDSTGTLDTTFGTNGIVVSDGASGVANDADDAYMLVLDSSGNIYVTGNSGEYTGGFDGDRVMVIWKYDSTGAPDNTFGTNGIVVHDGAAGGTDYDTGQDIILHASGNIYVTGYSVNSIGDEDMVIWKYDSTGTLDSTFGTGGIIVRDESAGGNDHGYGIDLDGSGNLYVTGYSEQNNGDMVIWNYK
jgi:uncharacterized delta-60 repeat protein